MAGEESAPQDPEIDALLRGLSQDMTNEDMENLEIDLRDVHYVRQVIDALVMEGVDISSLIENFDGQPDELRLLEDPTLQNTIDTFDHLLANPLLHDRDGEPKIMSDLTRRLFAEARNEAFGIQQVVWARKCIDDGMNLDEIKEAKIAMQLEFYTNRDFSGDEKQLWLCVLDRIIPEHPGLDPSDPGTAIEIEQWLA